MSAGAYEIERRNRFFSANRSIVEYEIRPGNTVTFLSEVDLSQVQRLRRSIDEAGLPKPSYTAFVVKALGLALRDYPYANRRVCRPPWLFGLGARLQRFRDCDVAVAAERQVPGCYSVAFADIVRRADEAPLSEISRKLHEIATADEDNNEQWRAFSTLIRKLPTWLSSRLIRFPYYAPGHWVRYRGAAAMVSSPAKYGVDAVVTTWSWPVGVSFGLVKERPVVTEGRVVARPTFILTLNFDRRVMAGAEGARFFNRIVEILESAEQEMSTYLPELQRGEDNAASQIDEKSAVAAGSCV